MKEPTRLFQDGSAFERSLLDSGRNEDPSRRLEKKILAAVAIAPAGVALEPSQAPAAPGSPSLFHLTTARGLAMAAAVIGIGAVIAASTGGGSAAPMATPAVPATSVAIPAPVPVHELEPSAPATATVTPDSLPNAPANAPAVVPSARASAVAIRSDANEAGASIDREIELLDAVKTRLGAGNAGDAARALDTYDAEFPRGTLRPEGTVLRIRTLLLQGNRAAASTLADQFLATHPSSVHAKRVRALLAD